MYNSGNHIHKCLDSIIRQDIQPSEIIIVDDHSTDNSPQLINQYRSDHSHIKVIRNKVNLGPGASRNKALKIARGEYIAFIDIDDWINDEYLIALYDSAKKANADIVFSNMKFVGGGTESEYKAFYVTMAKFKNLELSITDLPNEWRSTAPWMKLFRKGFVLDNQLEFCSDTRLGEDILFTWIAYSKAKIITFCEAAYYFYNISSQSLDTDVNESIFDIFKSLKITKQKYYKIDPSHSRLSQINTLYVSHLCYQFSKICTINHPQASHLAYEYWKKAHNELINIKPRHVIDNLYLSAKMKEYYFDTISHAEFDNEMREKYILRTK